MNQISLDKLSNRSIIGAIFRELPLPGGSPPDTLPPVAPTLGWGNATRVHYARYA